MECLLSLHNQLSNPKAIQQIVDMRAKFRAKSEWLNYQLADMGKTLDEMKMREEVVAGSVA